MNYSFPFLMPALKDLDIEAIIMSPLDWTDTYSNRSKYPLYAGLLPEA